MRRFVFISLLEIFLFLPGVGYSATFEELAQAATAAREARDVPGAIERYSAAVRMNPDWQEGWWYLGTFLFGTKQFTPAQDAFEHFVSLMPDSAPGWAFKSLSEMQTAQYEASLRDMDRSVELGIASQQGLADVLRTNRALLLSRLGHYDQALRLLATFVNTGQNPMLIQALGIAGLRRPLLPSEVPPADAGLVDKAGQALFLMLTGATPEAATAFEQFETQFPSIPGVHYLVGYFLFGQDMQKSRGEFRKELAVSPKNAEAVAMLAYTELLHGNPTQAVKLARSAVDLDERSPNAQYVSGRALLQTDQLSAAISALERSVALDPNNMEGRVALESAYMRAGRYREGKEARLAALRVSADESKF